MALLVQKGLRDALLVLLLCCGWGMLQVGHIFGRWARDVDLGRWANCMQWHVKEGVYNFGQFTTCWH